MTTRELGSVAELTALKFLEDRGLTLVTCNFSCKMGEIDLIMLDSKTLVFVEVRLRHDPRFGTGAETITRSKIRNIIRTAEFFLQNNPTWENLECRFDVISMDDKIDWIADAFTLDDQ